MTTAFGGEWSRRKLEVLRKYLEAYMVIMTRNPHAQHFRTWYVDAFAGSGRIYIKKPQEFDAFANDGGETTRYFDGSARVALRVEPPFSRYLFFELNRNAAQQLEALRTEFPHRTICVRVGDANRHLQDFCQQMEENDRAVVFLDPFGTEVRWSTVAMIAKTRRIDMWWLVPYGLLARGLPTSDVPSDANSAQLTAFLGTDVVTQREALSVVAAFIAERLERVFAGVLDKPGVLCNSKNAPMYLLCFAAANPKGAHTAVKIARCLVRNLHDVR